MNSKRIDLSAVLALCIVWVYAGSAPAQTCDWLPGQSPRGTGGTVHAVTVYGGDLIAGGGFTKPGGTPCNCIARWNGSTWQALGSGMGDGSDPHVHALTVHRRELIAGGGFTTAGGLQCNRIARWDGSTWQPLGSGMNDEVWALSVYDDELIAGGDFTTAGGLVSAHWARWGCKVCRGDLNCDGFVDFGDVNPFVLALSDWDLWKTRFPDCPERNADVNGDGQYGGHNGFGDINPFVLLLGSGQGQPIPCP